MKTGNNSSLIQKTDMFFVINEADYQKVYEVRKNVFGAEQGYCEKDLKLNNHPNEKYLLCLIDGQPVGTQTIQHGNFFGATDIDHYFNTSFLYQIAKQLIFCSRNAVLKNYRGTIIPILLYSKIFNYCCQQNIPFLLTDCKKDNSMSNKLFPKLGFVKIGECNKGSIGPVIVWGTTVNSTNTQKANQRIQGLIARAKNRTGRKINLIR